MTANQIAYWKNEEYKKANRNSEALRSSELEETARSNLAKEKETHRSNKRREDIEIGKSLSNWSPTGGLLKLLK